MNHYSLLFVVFLTNIDGSSNSCSDSRVLAWILVALVEFEPVQVFARVEEFSLV